MREKIADFERGSHSVTRESGSQSNLCAIARDSVCDVAERHSSMSNHLLIGATMRNAQIIVDLLPLFRVRQHHARR